MAIVRQGGLQAATLRAGKGCCPQIGLGMFCPAQPSLSYPIRLRSIRGNARVVKDPEQKRTNGVLLQTCVHITKVTSIVLNGLGRQAACIIAYGV